MPGPELAGLPVHPATVVELRLEAERVISLRLRADDDGFAPWTPGAHITLILPNRMSRQYSVIESDAAITWLRIAVLLEPAGRGGSEYIHHFLRPGQVVLVEGPRNKFPLPPAGPLTMFAGGIGITPILPMLRTATAQGRPWTLDYVGRRRESMPFLAELERDYGDRVRAWPTRRTGRVPLTEVLTAAPADTAVLACGPQGMLDSLELAVLESPLPDSCLHVERFKPRPRPPVVERPVLLRAARSQVDVQVDEKTSLLDGLLRAGIPINASCRNGVCGTCETRVLGGVPDHRDDVLTREQQEAGDTMLVCVSRAVGEELILDV